MSKKKSAAMSWFEESNSEWQEAGIFTLNDAELKSVVSCSITAYNGEYGVFIKLYMDIKVRGKILHLMGDEDANGKKRRGVKLDATSAKRYEYLIDEDDPTLEVDPEKVILMNLENTDDGRIIRRIRIVR
jgi:hypothetical protein